MPVPPARAGHRDRHWYQRALPAVRLGQANGLRAEGHGERAGLGHPGCPTGSALLRALGR